MNSNPNIARPNDSIDNIILDNEEEGKEGKGELIKLHKIGPTDGSRNRIAG